MSGWGKNQDWKTMTINLNDAYLGARNRSEGKPMSVDGFDLRIYGVNSPFHLRSVKITKVQP